MALGICSGKEGKGKKKMILAKNYSKIIEGGRLSFEKKIFFPGDN